MKRDDYQPFEVGTRLRVLPPGAVTADDGRVPLVVRRGAFGSGEHETTRSCLEELATTPSVVGASVLDVGCGTGVLCIAAVLLGARHAVGVDTDPAAIDVAHANCTLNNVARHVTLVSGVLADVTAGRFDVAVANVYADVLLSEGRSIVARATPDATIILSGVPWHDVFTIRRRYEGLGCGCVRTRMLTDYATLVFRRGREPRKVAVPQLSHNAMG